MTMRTLIETPTNQLLDDFGAGESTPGAGSAAALSAVLAANLALTVAKITLRKSGYLIFHDQTKAIEVDLLKNIIELKILFQNDSVAFSQVIEQRRLRDSTKNKRIADRHRAKELKLMRNCTEFPLAIADCALIVFYHSSTLLDNGFKSARGDSCTAASLCVAAAHGCSGIARLNLVKFERPSEWKSQAQTRLSKIETTISQCAETLVSKIRQIG